MRRSLTLIAVSLALVFFGAAPSAAAKRVALVVGNGAYEHTGALKNPINDAGDMTRKLASLGFKALSPFFL